MFVSGSEGLLDFPFIVEKGAEQLRDSPSIVENILVAPMKRMQLITSHNSNLCTTRLYPSLYKRGANVCTNVVKLSKRLNNLKIGGARRDRTVDLYAASVALSQLSYGPVAFKGRAFRHSAPALSI